MSFGLTKLARLVLVALTLAGATAGAARADHGHDDGRLELRFLGQQIIPTATQFQGTQFGGLSGFAYDRHRRVFYALSDDQTNVRFYTLRIDVSTGVPAVQILAVTTLRDATGQPFAPLSVDPEGLALTKRGTLVITSEGFATRLIDPWVREFSLDGRQLRSLPVPAPFLPVADGSRGVRQNLGFESAGTTPNGRYVFTGTEAALVQDGPPATLTDGSPARLLRYDLKRGRLDRQYVYWTDPIAGAARACDPVRGQRARRAAAAQERRAARDGAVVLGRRARDGQQDQPLRRLADACRQRQRLRQPRDAARRAASRPRRRLCSTSTRSESRSTTSRGWRSARICPTAAAR